VTDEVFDLADRVAIVTGGDTASVRPPRTSSPRTAPT